VISRCTARVKYLDYPGGDERSVQEFVEKAREELGCETEVLTH